MDFYHNDLYGLRKVVGKIKADAEREEAKKGPQTMEVVIQGEVFEIPVD